VDIVGGRTNVGAVSERVPFVSKGIWNVGVSDKFPNLNHSDVAPKIDNRFRGSSSELSAMLTERVEILYAHATSGRG